MSRAPSPRARGRVRRLPFIIVAGAALGLSAPALGAGGATIATAPTLVYGQREAPGGETGTLWRVAAFTGDLLTLSVEAARIDTLDIKHVHAGVFDPGVDDARLAGAASVATTEVAKIGAVEITLEVPFTGLGTLMVCVRRAGDCRSGGTVSIWGFAFVASVAHRTTLSLTAPRVAGARGSVTVVARVRSPAGVPSGRCVIHGIKHPLRGGTCTARVLARTLRGGTIRARFTPDPDWQPASASRRIRVDRQ